LLSVY